MENFKQKVEDFSRLVETFQYEEAEKKYYHPDFVKHENENAPTIGLAQHRKEMRQFQNSISNESATLKELIISDDMSVAEWHYQFDHKDWGHKDFMEISIQRWKDGKIIHERHHYRTE